MKALLLIAVAAMAVTSAEADATTDFIKSLEGFSPTPYECRSGGRTIGYGSTSPALLARGYVTEAEATGELRRACDRIAARLRSAMGLGSVLKPNEETAVVSFIYNVGWGAFARSTLCARIKRAERGATVAAEFGRWKYVTNRSGRKEVSAGLVKRRRREASMFQGL